MPAESINRRLSRWVSGLTYADLPPEIVDRARGVTLQGLSSCLLGHAFPETKQAIRLVEEEEHGMAGTITVLVDGRRFSRAGAAFINSEMMFAGGKWDTFRMVAHPGGAVLPATAYDRSGTNKIAEGTLQTFDSQIDPTTGTIKLRAQFPNDGRTLYPNQFVNVRLLLDTHQDVTTISTAGVQRGVPGTFVYLINADNTAERRPLEIEATEDGIAIVGKGIALGETIVVDGQYRLTAGSKVRIDPPAAGAPVPATSPKKSG